MSTLGPTHFHASWCPAPAGLDCLCGADPREATRSSSGGENRTRAPAVPHSRSENRKPARNGGPPTGPPRPVNAAEKRMVERGWRAGYELGRHGEEPACPYGEGSRPAWLWVRGAAVGFERGRQQLAIVRESYRLGLEQLEAGAPKVW